MGRDNGEWGVWEGNMGREYKEGVWGGNTGKGITWRGEAVYGEVGWVVWGGMEGRECGLGGKRLLRERGGSIGREGGRGGEGIIESGENYDELKLWRLSDS